MSPEFSKPPKAQSAEHLKIAGERVKYRTGATKTRSWLET